MTVNETPELEGDEAGECDDGVDNDQDGTTDCDDAGCRDSTACADAPIDNDGDGSPSDEDCDDEDPLNFPGNEEDCDGRDNDCDGLLGPDEIDDDNDGVTECDGDCDDQDALNFPGNPEVCDGQDNDCDLQLLPEEVDDDNDGVTECDGDCNDNAPLVYPQAGDTYGDGIDGDCDGANCEGGTYGSTYFVACTQLMLWADANAECLSLGYDGLATVVDAGEQAFLEALRPLPATIKHWIGFNDIAADGVYEWVSGLPVTYTHWYPATEPTGQPGTDEDCVHFWESGSASSDGFWNDNWCSTTTHGWFCEIR